MRHSTKADLIAAGEDSARLIVESRAPASSLAEARLGPGQSTTPHFHPKTEEIYYILASQAWVQIGDDRRAVGPGDAIAIPPGQVHQITNSGSAPLVFLCCCAPGYEHDDTVLVSYTLTHP